MRAETIAGALGEWKAGESWVAQCPGYDDREPTVRNWKKNGLPIIDRRQPRRLYSYHAGIGEPPRNLSELRVPDPSPRIARQTGCSTGRIRNRVSAGEQTHSEDLSSRHQH